MRTIFTLVLCGTVMIAGAQQASPFTKFGKITPEQFKNNVYSIDSGANAVVLSDIGAAVLEGNSKGWFSITFVRHRVVHILNKNGYHEADVEIPLFTAREDEEKLESVKAITYNLENGKIAESKLEKSAVFKEKRSDNLAVKKFTFPNVKEGCIVEYEYKVVSDFLFNLDPWLFQGQSPVLWSEYKLTVPEFFSYAFLSRGYHPLFINEKNSRTETFNVRDTRTAGASENYTFTSNVTDYRWVMKDVPEMKEESFTSSLANHISRIEFQLASQNYPLATHNYRNTWPSLSRELLESDHFGNALKNNNSWLSDDLKPVMASQNNELEKAKKVFAFVRDNFVCTDYSGIFCDQSLKNVLKTKKGSVPEINLMLTAMLRYAGVHAEPVILSTKSHGYALEMYPMLQNFNYVVAKVKAGNQEYYLDAAQPRLGFGRLLPNCYNGHARVVNEEATPITLNPDSLKEQKFSALFIANDEKGRWMAKMNRKAGYFESFNIRNKIKEKGREGFFRDVQKELGTDITVTDEVIDSLDNYDEPVAITYQFEIKHGAEDILYVNPMFGEAYKDNPFKSATRLYPVEMPYTSDETFILTMEVPAGYEVDELPKQILAKLDEENSGYFEYRITHSGNTVSMRCRIKFNRTLFMPDEYENLREFFNLVVSKQNEQIVFRKKK